MTIALPPFADEIGATWTAIAVLQREAFGIWSCARSGNNVLDLSDPQVENPPCLSRSRDPGLAIGAPIGKVP